MEEEMLKESTKWENQVRELWEITYRERVKRENEDRENDYKNKDGESMREYFKKERKL